MNLPEACPFCGAGVLVMAGGFECRNGQWVTFDCHTSIHARQAERRTQSRTCEDAERARLAARVAELEAENKDLRDRFSDADTERNAAQAALKATFARVAELEERCKRLEELGAVLRVCAGYLGWTCSDDSDCIARAERACEAWDKEAKG